MKCYKCDKKEGAYTARKGICEQCGKYTIVHCIRK